MYFLGLWSRSIPVTQYFVSLWSKITAYDPSESLTVCIADDGAPNNNVFDSCQTMYGWYIGFCGCIILRLWEGMSDHV